MRRSFIIAWAFLLAGLCCIQQSSAFWQSRDSNYNLAISNGSFQGVGDIVSGWTTYYGMWAYSAATRGNPLLNVCNSTGGVDVLCADLSSDPTTGLLDAGIIGGITCPGANCTVKTAYDLSGANKCSSAPCNETQATIASRPTLSASCVGGIPCMVCNGSQSLVNSIYALGVPQTISAVTMRTGAFTSFGGIIGWNAFPSMLFSNAANQIDWVSKGGADNKITAADSAFHAVQGTSDGTNGIVYVDGASNSVASSGLSGAEPFDLCSTDVHLLTGDLIEGGTLAVAVTSTQAGNINSNQHSRNGF